MSQQVTCTVDDALKDWLQTMSQDLGISEAEVQRRCLRSIRSHDDPHTVLQPYADKSVTAYDLRDELQALRERVQKLEDNTQDTVETPAVQDAAARPHSDQSVNADWVSEHGDWSAAESAETPAKNVALADAYKRIQDAGQLDSSDVKAVYDDHDLDVARSTWAREVLSVLRTLPGIQGPEPGQSTWTYSG
jgi:hypothetical protein